MNSRCLFSEVKGRDSVDGGSDKDTLGGGDDILFGSSGDDDISGNNGNDYLQGDSGNDLLKGGSGEDKFGFATGTSFNINDLGVDIIRDFKSSQGDKIQLSKFTFPNLSNTVFPSPLSATDFGTVTSDCTNSL